MGSPIKLSHPAAKYMVSYFPPQQQHSVGRLPKLTGNWIHTHVHPFFNIKLLVWNTQHSLSRWPQWPTSHSCWVYKCPKRQKTPATRTRERKIYYFNSQPEHSNRSAICAAALFLYWKETFPHAPRGEEWLREKPARPSQNSGPCPYSVVMGANLIGLGQNPNRAPGTGAHHTKINTKTINVWKLFAQRDRSVYTPGWCSTTGVVALRL